MTGPDRAEGTAVDERAELVSVVDEMSEVYREDSGSIADAVLAAGFRRCAEGTAVLSDVERALLLRIRAHALALTDGEEPSDLSLAFTGLAVSQHYRLAWKSARRRALAARAALPGTADTGVREAVERGVRACLIEEAPMPLIREDDVHHVVHMVTTAVLAALAATPDGHQHTAEES